MKLNGKSLAEWLGKQKPKNFPKVGKEDYSLKYKKIKEFLDNEVHPHINSRTLQFDEGVYLTKHGTEHIDVVINRLSLLIDGSELSVSPYEVYLLLVATQLHDTGHIKNGREGHEKLSSEIINSLGLLMGNDTPEKKVIWDIAQAHGGRKSNGKKDKIEDLPGKDAVLGQTVRPQMLAALLRFADELADDSSRASYLLLDEGLITKQSQVYHVYASVLDSVEVDHIGKEIRLSYFLGKKHIKEKFGKEDSTVFLIDEIYERLYKMFLECLYCMRFIPYNRKILTINAKIKFIDSQSLVDFREPISIKLTEKGYPRIVEGNLFELCPDLTINGVKIDGEYLNETIENV